MRFWPATTIWTVIGDMVPDFRLCPNWPTDLTLIATGNPTD